MRLQEAYLTSVYLQDYPEAECTYVDIRQQLHSRLCDVSDLADHVKARMSR